MYNNWWLNIDKGDMTSVVFLDIRKAFDTVNHQILLDKLHCYGIGDGEMLFFRSYLQNRTQCCSVNGQISTLQTVTCGVLQGSILGPLLFIIFMNDLPAFVQEASITMYTDDTSLHKAFRTSYELKEEIIPAFSKVCKWLRNNKLSLNTVKSEFMIIGTLPRLKQLDSSPESTPYAIVVDGQEVERVKLVKYLGLVVNDKLVWDQHIDYISSKIKRGIGILKRIRHFIPRDSLLLIYHTLIEPYFRYCSIVWGQCGETLKDKLQTLQNKAAQTIARLRYDEASHYELLTEFGWLSVRNLISLDTAIFVYKEINNFHPEQADSLIQRLDYFHSYSTRSVSNNNLFIPKGKTNNFQKTEAFAGSKIWNEIPKEIRMAQTLQSFKEHLKKHLAEQQAQSS